MDASELKRRAASLVRYRDHAVKRRERAVKNKMVRDIQAIDHELLGIKLELEEVHKQLLALWR